MRVFRKGVEGTAAKQTQLTGLAGLHSATVPSLVATGSGFRTLYQKFYTWDEVKLEDHTRNGTVKWKGLTLVDRPALAKALAFNPWLSNCNGSTRPPALHTPISIERIRSIQQPEDGGSRLLDVQAERTGESIFDDL